MKKTTSPFLAAFRSVLKNYVDAIYRWIRSPKVFYLVEFLIIIVWGLYVTKPYLNLSPRIIPTGREYVSAIQTHDLWEKVKECGLCALWDGSLRGGAPSFVDVHGSSLHPIVVITTLVFGVFNGSKIALVIAFITAGIVQWWLAYLLGAGPVPRVWSGMMAIVAGGLVSRMELGAFGVVLSTVFCGAIFPAIILLFKQPNNRATVILAVTIALAILSGQGYMQLGFAFTVFALISFITYDRSRNIDLLRRFVVSFSVALILAAVFIVPLVHFLPEFSKEIDPAFKAYQPMKYMVLNLVIDLPEFYNTDALLKPAYPHLTGIFLGWIPVVFAVIGSLKSDRKNRRVIIYLVTSATILFFVASAVPLRYLTEHLPQGRVSEFIAGIRHPPQISGLTFVPILGLAALGIEYLLKLPIPKVRFSLGDTSIDPGNHLIIDIKWLLIIPLLISLVKAKDFGSNWITTTELKPDIQQVLLALKPVDLQLVNPPFGEHFWMVDARALNLKMSTGIRTWYWRFNEFPTPVYEASRMGPPPGAEKVVATFNDIVIYQSVPGSEYASVMHIDGTRSICSADGVGAMIDVDCNLTSAGKLVVKENSWSGWHATVNGVRTPLEKDTQWLSVKVPAGNVKVEFRYQPWDVPVGFALSLFGLGLCVWLWRRDSARKSVTSLEPENIRDAGVENIDHLVESE